MYNKELVRNRILFRAGIPASCTQTEIAECLINRLEEIIIVAKACEINLSFDDCDYNDNTKTIYVWEDEK